MVAHLGVLAVAAMIMGKNSVTPIHGCCGKSGVAAGMLAQAMDDRDNAMRLAGRLPSPER
jgi:hypothetical protein